MAKMTISGLQSFVSTYVKAASQAGAWTKTTNNIFGLLDKIGKQITIVGEFNNPLAAKLSGNDLPLGKTIEEYFVDLTMPVDPIDPSEATGAEALKSYLPEVEEVAYSYSLGRKIIPTTVPYGNLERAAINATNAANFIADITIKQENSQSLYEYSLMKQLLGNMCAKADAAGLSTIVGALDTTEAQESFIKTVKKDVEKSHFAGENRSLGKQLIGATPKGELTLFIKAGVMPAIAVDTIAGAINPENLGMDCDVVVIDDFGLNDSNITALLVDTRGVKLHSGYKATRTNENGFMNQVNIFKHSEYVGYVSKNVFVKEYKNA